jgi:ribose transport system substrate-binding protein
MAQGQEKKVIGVSLLTLQSQFHQELKASMEKAALACGFELVLRGGEFNAGAQCGQIDDFVTRKVDAIILTPCDSSAAGMSIEQANRAHIPVFTVDVANTGTRGVVTSHIGSDNVLGGRKAAELMVEALGGKGNVILTTHLGVTSVADRIRGFKEVNAKTPAIRILGEMPIWSDPRAQAAALMRGLLAKMPNLGAVFCINDEIALGTLAAVEEAHKVGQIVIVGYDATAEARAAIERGAIYGDVVQHPAKIGEQAVMTVRDHLSGTKVPPVISVEVGVVT